LPEPHFFARSKRPRRRRSSTPCDAHCSDHAEQVFQKKKKKKKHRMVVAKSVRRLAFLALRCASFRGLFGCCAIDFDATRAFAHGENEKNREKKKTFFFLDDEKKMIFFLSLSLPSHARTLTLSIS
jgi:hypothetical protein